MLVFVFRYLNSAQNFGSFLEQVFPGNIVDEVLETLDVFEVLTSPITFCNKINSSETTLIFSINLSYHLITLKVERSADFLSL